MISKGRLLTVALSVAFFSDVIGAQAPLGVFDGETDVGRARASGSTAYDPQRQEYLVAGSGQNMWTDRDDFHFVWKRLTGNFILSTRARFIGAGVEPHRKIGWTIRPSLETNSPHVTAALHGDGLTSLQLRRATGGITEEGSSRDSLPGPDAVIQLERRDGVYLMSVARFGDTLVTRELEGVSLPDTVYVGLFVCAHNNTVVERAAFSNVRITTPAQRDLVLYREYIGSNLEILDVATGNATIVHSYRGSFQAPNWTPDGKALIYAQEGLLYRFDLPSRAAEPINTGFATRNNNDHVLSFDGRMMAISHHAAEDSGASIIYTLPATGGMPKRVTPKGPSYLHGWSPDARWLVYTGIRGNELDVYKIPVTGGSEIRLTTAPGLDDGPEFTPDGVYIYFNSSRTGRMQIWRMRPDGTQQQQITNDGFNNWFPHISPEGKQIAYIAFPPDVPANDHPFYKHVTLRLMPVGGGPARVISYVYGGQGTINVPSWSPDGKRLAFVSNSTIAATGTTIVVVRHAEKGTDDPRDPSLSAAGVERARALSSVLKDAGVSDIYTTHYKRTRQTAEPLAQQLGIEIQERPINAANSATYARDLAQEILTRSAGKGVLVVGHSNTVPDIVKALSGITVPAITDAEYDHIFVVVIPASGSPRLMQLRFGAPAP